MPLSFSVCLAYVFPLAGLGAAEQPRFELKSGDRVVLIGSGLIEQERRFGYLEMRLSRRLPEGSIVFRNLGWAGDTVRGIARTGGYQNPEGFARLVKEVQDYKPTVLIIGYGTNESFDGAAGLAAFRADYEKLLAKLAPLKARIILLSPTYQEDLGRPFPDPAAHNRDVDNYALAIGKMAEERQLAFVDLRKIAKADAPKRPWTTNGLQFNETGADQAARTVEVQLSFPRRNWFVECDVAGKNKISRREGTDTDDVAVDKQGIRFQARDRFLPAAGDEEVLRVLGLPAGKYALRIDGKLLRIASSDEWEKGVSVPLDAVLRDTEELRSAIVHNNALFYRRWRPFNDHSRHWGFIGGDGALYDKEIAAQEKFIADLRRPRPHQYEIFHLDE